MEMKRRDENGKRVAVFILVKDEHVMHRTIEQDHFAQCYAKQKKMRGNAIRKNEQRGKERKKEAWSPFGLPDELYPILSICQTMKTHTP